MSLLRFVTTGSVDDGKSTLIGRMLYDSRALQNDRLEEIQRLSRTHGKQLNLALITDGLRGEREKGITIDVAYQYFSTPKRRFVIIDAPGHIEYMRNMVTGASGADVGLVLIDATRGLQEQTRRHAFLLSLLRVSTIMVCVNKMDLLSYSSGAFEKIQSEYQVFAGSLNFERTIYLPISALYGDNIVARSENMPWFTGPPLLSVLEELPPGSDPDLSLRFPIQSRASDGRVLGIVMAGEVQKGQEVLVLSRDQGLKRACVSAIHQYPDKPRLAKMGASISLELEGISGVNRGDLVFQAGCEPIVSREVVVDVCWFSSKPLALGTSWILRHTTNEVQALVTEIIHQIETRGCSEQKAPSALLANEFGRVRLKLEHPVFFDPYEKSRLTGSGILIDQVTHATAAAVMFSSPG